MLWSMKWEKHRRFGGKCSLRVESSCFCLRNFPFYLITWLVCTWSVHSSKKTKLATMFILVPGSLKSHFSIHHKIFHIKSVIFLLCLNACLKISVVIAGPTIQQEQELLLLEALSKRQPSYYGTSNSLMDILGRSMYA